VELHPRTTVGKDAGSIVVFGRAYYKIEIMAADMSWSMMMSVDMLAIVCHGTIVSASVIVKTSLKSEALVVLNSPSPTTGGSGLFPILSLVLLRLSYITGFIQCVCVWYKRLAHAMIDLGM